MPAENFIFFFIATREPEQASFLLAPRTVSVLITDSHLLAAVARLGPRCDRLVAHLGIPL